MAAIRLERRPQRRIWGRRTLPAGFEDVCADGPVGEVWYENGAGSPLLVKYLFTSEPLSIQVHPDDAAARARGHPHGKDEAWLVLDAAPGAVIGRGLKRPISADALRSAALDGSIEALVDWLPVSAGDVLLSPAGTIHAIGGGLTLIEVQQNIDLTYRLYDYGRPRELHLDDGVAVARAGPCPPAPAPAELGPGRQLLAPGGSFTLERWAFADEREVAAAEKLLLVPLASGGRVDGDSLAGGSVWQLHGRAVLGGGIDALAAYAGPPRPELLKASS